MPTRLWVSPPTKMDEKQLTAEGYYSIYGTAGARTEMPGCSLCMGNQARVADNSTCVSTSTRNFPNRLGNGANVFLSSAEVATAAAILGKLPTPAEYLEISSKLSESVADKADTYRYTRSPHAGQPAVAPLLCSARFARCRLTGCVLACRFRCVCVSSYLNFHMLDDYVSKSEESFDVLAKMDAK